MVSFYFFLLFFFVFFPMMFFSFKKMVLFSHTFGGLYLPLVLDWYSITFVVVLFIMVFSVVIFSSYYMPQKKSFCFYLVFFSFVFSMVLLILIPDFLFFLMGWDGLGVTSFLLIIYYQSNSSWFSGFKTFLINRLGDGFLMVFLCLFLSDSFLCFFCFYDYVWSFFIFFFILGLITKSALFPFKSWLPAAMAAPTPVSALVHSSTLVTSGVFILIRKFFILSSDSFLFFLFVFSFYTMVLGSFGALYDWDIKKIMAFSTLSQLGLMVLMMALGNLEMGFFHLLSHACFKALMFMVSGVLILKFSHNQDMRVIKSSTPPVILVIFNFCLMSLSGLFFLSGFYSKDSFILNLGLGGSLLFNFLFCLVLSLTLGYSMRLFFFVSFSEGLFFFTFPYFIIVGLLPLFFLSVFLGGFLNNLFFSYIYVSWGYMLFFFFFLVLMPGFKFFFFKYKNYFLQTFNSKFINSSLMVYSIQGFSLKLYILFEVGLLNVFRYYTFLKFFNFGSYMKFFNFFLLGVWFLLFSSIFFFFFMF